MGDMYVGYLEPERIQDYIKERVKDFILRVSRNEQAFWTEDHCVIWNYDKGIPVTVDGGSSYAKDENVIYLKHYPDRDVPSWLPGVLSAIAQFFGISRDPEVSDAILKVAVNLATGIFRPLQQNLAQTFNGDSIAHLAINSKENLLAGQYPPDPFEPDGLPTWRLQLSAEPVDVSTPEWSKFSL